MFFYNTVGGGFRFKPVNEMFEDEFPLTFSMTPRTSTDLEDYDLNAEGGTNTQVLAFTSPQTFNTLLGIRFMHMHLLLKCMTQLERLVKIMFMIWKRHGKKVNMYLQNLHL